MREKFRGYYRPTAEEEDLMWASAHIVMDTNVVLDLYKYHARTTDLYLRSLASFEDQLWLPYQVALEFHKNRPKVRGETTKGHKERIKELEVIRNKIKQNTPKSKLASSTVEEELIAKTEEVLEALRGELKQLSDEVHVNSPDKLLDRITELFDGRVGDAPTAEELSELKNVAKRRFDDSVPPGYEDRKTKAPGDEYGDFFLWQQTMDYAKTQGKNIIIATEDNKADWWLKINGDEIVGPRPELVQEFRSETGQEILFYSGRKFFEQLSDRAKISGSQEDLEGALADVTSVSDERLAALSAWKEAASAVQERRQSMFEDVVGRQLHKEGWSHRTAADANSEADVLREHMARLLRREHYLYSKISALLAQLAVVDDIKTRKKLEEQLLMMHELMSDLQRQMKEVSDRIHDLGTSDEFSGRDESEIDWRDVRRQLKKIDDDSSEES